jgi:hypothetical protein
MVVSCVLISICLPCVYLHTIPLYRPLHGDMMHSSLEYITMLYYTVLTFFHWCSVDELQRLLRDKEAYNAFFNSLDQVKTQNKVGIVKVLFYLIATFCNVICCCWL